jgi:hypothetical protein
VDASGLLRRLSSAGFDVVSMVDVDQSGNRGFHWTVFAET